MPSVALSKMGIHKILARHTGENPKPMGEGSEVLAASPSEEEGSLALDPQMELMEVLIKAIHAKNSKLALRQFKRLMDTCSFDSEEDSDEME